MRTLYHSGQIWTANTLQPLAEAFVVDGDRFLAVGSRWEVEHLLNPGDLRVDLGGCLVLPGLIDAHVHFSWFSLGLTEVNLDGTPTLQAALERVREHASHLLPGAWVRGSGFNANAWERWPNRYDLDAVVPENPVVLSSKDFHSIWTNSQALDRANIGSTTTTPFSGEIERDHFGHPTGIFKEQATELVWKAVPPYTHQEYVSAIGRGLPRATEVGVTGVHDMDSIECFRALQELGANEQLSVRFFKQIPESAFRHAIAAGLRTGFGNQWLRVGCLKLFADGSLGSRTAHMLEPFEGFTGYRGVPVHTPSELDELVATAVVHDIAVAVHAIGDAANRVVLDTFGKVADRSKEKGLRHRIEHAQLLAPTEISRFAQLEVIASVQPSHAPSDRYTADRLWGSRCRRAYAFKSLLDSGARLAFGSDVPVEPLNPLAGIHAAVWRKREDEPSSESWYPLQRLTVAQAIHGFTLGAAYASGEELLKGSIEFGKLADFVVLTHNILSGDEDALCSVRPRATIVGGQLRFGGI